MFTQIHSFIRNTTRKVWRSIAFYPTVLAIAFVLLAIGLLALENEGLTGWVQKHVSIFIVPEPDTARAIITTLIGALISLTVFSFTMVMVVLNQASSNYTPRLLPNLISNKRHQLVLGSYIGTLCFYLIVIVSISPEKEVWQLPGFTVFVAVFLAIFNVGLFVYFIHGISQSIQIDNILANLYEEGKASLTGLKKDREGFSVVDSYPNTEGWTTIPADRSGYIDDIDLSALARLSQQCGGTIYCQVPESEFVLTNVPIACCSWPVIEEECKKITAEIDILRSIPEDEELISFRRITEVAVKAMSPGINDPGTALTAIDYLASLFAYRLKVPEYNCYTGKEGGKVYFSHVRFGQLLATNMESLRLYCKHDISLVLKMLSVFKYLLLQEETDPQQRADIGREIRALLEDVEQNIENSFDKRKIQTHVAELETLLNEKTRLPNIVA